jgi:hypothetical protein
MHLIEKVFVKARNYSRHFDTQKNLSQSHKEINRPIYEKALFELEDAITELIKEKVKKIIKAQRAKDDKKPKKDKPPEDNRPPKDEKPPENNGSEKRKPEGSREGHLLTDGIEDE